MSDLDWKGRLILPGHPDFNGIQDAPDPPMVRYVLPVNDGSGGTRFVALKQEAKPAGYFDDVFTNVLQLTTAAPGTPYALLAHGCQVVWVFASLARTEAHERMTEMEKQLGELKTQVAELRDENADLRLDLKECKEASSK